MASDSDKIKMSRLLKLAKKFNCFYLAGKLVPENCRRLHFFPFKTVDFWPRHWIQKKFASRESAKHIEFSLIFRGRRSFIDLFVRLKRINEIIHLMARYDCFCHRNPRKRNIFYVDPRFENGWCKAFRHRRTPIEVYHHSISAVRTNV